MFNFFKPENNLTKEGFFKGVAGYAEIFICKETGIRVVKGVVNRQRKTYNNVKNLDHAWAIVESITKRGIFPNL